MANPNRSPVYSNPFFYLIKTFYLRHFISEFSFTRKHNGRPINIYSYTIWLQNGVSCLYKTIYKTHFQSLTLWFTNNMCSKEMICIWRGIHLYAATFSMTLRFLLLAFFMFTQNLHIDKNYTLSIFMLSGSMQFYSNFPI